MNLTNLRIEKPKITFITAQRKKRKKEAQGWKNGKITLL
jgi:hypothetical protein